MPCCMSHGVYAGVLVHRRLPRMGSRRSRIHSLDPEPFTSCRLLSRSRANRLEL